jgi:LAS superfamily LD-carboxypeptidase LdcB
MWNMPVSYRNMIAGAKAAGVDVKIFSGYRSEEKQAQLYNDKVSKLMEEVRLKSKL